MKDGSRCDICKTCLTENVDNYKPDTFMWILEKFDVPYVEHIWRDRTNKEYLKNPQKFGPMSVIGKYIRSMNMAQYAEYGFEDTVRLNYEYNEEKDRQERMRESFEERLKERLDAGEISQEEFDEMTKESKQAIDNLPEVESSDFVRPVDVTETTIEQELSQQDIKYLALKWGIAYKPSEWVKMEDLYQKYAAEYELNADREDTLKKICKISLKMDQALDSEDYQGFQRLSTTFDALRKSAKFTEVQNKEEETRELDSIGELVNFVEREGGVIPQKDNPVEYPQDKIDFIIKDMQNYIDTLVKNELGLGDLIETYIEKLDKQKVESVEDIMNNSFRKTEEEDSVTEEEAKSFADFYMEEIEKESYRLADGDLFESE